MLSPLKLKFPLKSLWWYPPQSARTVFWNVLLHRYVWGKLHSSDSPESCFLWPQVQLLGWPSSHTGSIRVPPETFATALRKGAMGSWRFVTIWGHIWHKTYAPERKRQEKAALTNKEGELCWHCLNLLIQVCLMNLPLGCLFNGHMDFLFGLHSLRWVTVI